MSLLRIPIRRQLQMLLPRRVFNTACVVIKIADNILGLPNVFFALEIRLLAGYCLYEAIGKKWERIAEV